LHNLIQPEVYQKDVEENLFTKNKNYGNLLCENSFHSFAARNMEPRERILVKAHELFNRYGFKRVTMDEIALKTGMSKKTIYQCFATKDEIVNAVVEEHLSKMVSVCEKHTGISENAIHEIFINIDVTQEMLSELNPDVFDDMVKFFPAVFVKLYLHKNEYLFKKVKNNIEWGIRDGYYREEINVDVITRLRIETLFFPFNQQIFPYGKYNVADVERETLEHYIYGLATPEGHALIKKYKQQRLKNK